MHGTLAAFRAYAAARGDNAPTAATDSAATAALVRASDMIDYRYLPNLAEGNDATLPVVELATYVAASLELAKPGFFAKIYTPSEQKVLTEVKGIKWTVVGKAGGAFASAPTSTIIEAMFAPYLSRPMPFALVV